jgi:ribose transport system ATP-binding protein/rhamnose transport system ATP-binding protein
VALLGIHGASKRFAATRALSDVTFRVEPGTVHGLIGANGAGKSTLLKLLSGALAPDVGRIEVGDQELSSWSPASALRAGVAMVYQETALVPQMNAVQNLALGAAPRRYGWILRRRRAQESKRALRDVGLTATSGRPVGGLTAAQQQLIEIAKALHAESRVIAFDEPTSSLTPGEASHLFETIKRLRAEGRGLIYVSHRLEEVLELADEITVLRNGRVVKHYELGTTEGVDETRLVRDMMGGDYEKYIHRPRDAAGVNGGAALSVAGLTSEPSFRDVSFEVQAGEVLGMFGLVGAGRSEVLRAIYGLLRADGEIRIGDRRIARPTPRKAIDAGIAYLPEDRKRQGLIPGMPIATNVTLPFLRSRTGWLRRGKQRASAREGMKRAGLTADPLRPVAALSGGNQQKALVARALLRDFAIYLFDEPTRGIDVATKAEIYTHLQRLAEGGAAVVVVSSEIEEVSLLSHRILVMHEGEVVAEISNDPAVPHSTLLELASGIKAEVA